MPAIQIDNVGTQLYYYDSGPPALQDTPYTTLVLCHGFIFNSYTLRKLLPIAAASHVRLVLLNRRGYRGCTPLGESETAAQASPELYETFLRKRAKELATFLVKFIELEGIPPISQQGGTGRASGGISLAGWSLGNIQVSAVLAYADTFESGLVGGLSTHLRKVVQYDAPYHVGGFPIPQDSWSPLWDPDIPEAERPGRFIAWVSSYWNHSPHFADAPPSRVLKDGLLEQRTANPDKPPTVPRFTPDESANGIEPITSKNGDAFTLIDEHRPVTREMFRKVLFTKKENEGKALVLGDVEVRYVNCREAHWDPCIMVPLVKAEMESPPVGYHLYRSIKFSWIEGCNHFAHYDDPIKTFAALAQALE